MDLVSHAWKFMGLGFSEVKIKFHKPRKIFLFLKTEKAAEYCYDLIATQISKDFQSTEVEKKKN